MRVDPVRVIGGPTGGSYGPRGPAGGRNSMLLTGATGMTGVMGMVGPTGFAGPAGLASLLMGMAGASGPSGTSLATGPTGSQGWNLLLSADPAYFENSLGLTLVSNSSVYLGCKFFYTIGGSGQFFVIATGDWVPSAGDVFHADITWGAPPAPNSGVGSPGFAGNVSSWLGTEIQTTPGTGKVFPFTVMGGPFLGQDQNRLPGREYWFDLMASGHGTIQNICLAVMEF